LFALAILSLIPTFVGKKYEANLNQQTQITSINDEKAKILSDLK
jgi:hypothetical protein